MSEEHAVEAAAAPATAEAAPPELVEGPHPLEALVERWWADHFPGSVVARYTECWNYAHGAKEALKALLRQPRAIGDRAGTP
ncbi:MAG TPA: hypothetical protein VFA12_19740 [Stellaceae bacterium]|nr:hypothetical protein [Stellaceae bacterium]